ncbi:hypothetical protein WR25_07844 [Diploscapter pachys]|uniref:Lipocalin domain-containing protein n=1 Tax=Diploscapter pachys TaxID=2018661 RepID=A0A2A2JFI6_9BILA|nr:hypothetical protein WR25_07844 [Diploscapter pachys]
MRTTCILIGLSIVGLSQAQSQNAPDFGSLPAGSDPDMKATDFPKVPENKVAKESLYKVGQIAENVLERLGLGQAGYTSKKDNVRRAPLPSTLYQVGQLFPQIIPPANTLIGSSINRILPKDSAKNLAKDVFRAIHPAAENVDVARMMGRWFTVINSPHVVREACTVLHFGALTNATYSAQFTILKFYREGNPNGPPRYALGYGFKSGETGQFVLHSSNSPDAEPFWVVKKGPLNEYNQYDYAIVSTWVRFPVIVIARDPERFRKEHMKNVLQFLDNNNYINVFTKAFNMISPVDYEACQYTPTFSNSGK